MSFLSKFAGIFRREEQHASLSMLRPRIVALGVGGAGGNAVNNMVRSGMTGVAFLAADTDAQALSQSLAEGRLQLGRGLTEGLGAGARPEVGRAAAEEAKEEILRHLQNAHMAFITAGMGGGTGTGAAPYIARLAREQGTLTVGVVTKPFEFEGDRRTETAEGGIAELAAAVDTLIVIPNQNLFRVASADTTVVDAFRMADDVLLTGVRSLTEMMVQPGLVNLDFADIQSVMQAMGKAKMGVGVASGAGRGEEAAKLAITNPLLSDVSLKGARGVIVNVTGGSDVTLNEIHAVVTTVRDAVDPEANLIFGSAIRAERKGSMRVTIFATGIDSTAADEDASAATDEHVRKAAAAAGLATQDLPATGAKRKTKKAAAKKAAAEKAAKEKAAKEKAAAEKAAAEKAAAEKAAAEKAAAEKAAAEKAAAEKAAAEKAAAEKAAAEKAAAEKAAAKKAAAEKAAAEKAAAEKAAAEKAAAEKAAAEKAAAEKAAAEKAAAEKAAEDADAVPVEVASEKWGRTVPLPISRRFRSSSPATKDPDAALRILSHGTGAREAPERRGRRTAKAADAPPTTGAQQPTDDRPDDATAETPDREAAVSRFTESHQRIAASIAVVMAMLLAGVWYANEHARDAEEVAGKQAGGTVVAEAVAPASGAPAPVAAPKTEEADDAATEPVAADAGDEPAEAAPNDDADTEAATASADGSLAETKPAQDAQQAAQNEEPKAEAATDTPGELATAIDRAKQDGSRPFKIVAKPRSKPDTRPWRRRVGKRLSGAQLRALMPGAETRGIDTRGRSFVVRFAPDGTVLSSNYQEDSGGRTASVTENRGTWKVVGDSLCVKYSTLRGYDGDCFKIAKSGEWYTTLLADGSVRSKFKLSRN